MYLFLRILISPLDVTHLAWIHVLKKSKKWPSAYIVAEAHCWNIELLLFTHRMFRNHGNTKNHLILYLRYASFSYKKLLWKSLKAFLKSTFAQLFYNPFYLFQVSMVLSAWKMAPLLRSKNCTLPKILILLLDVSTCQNLCIPPPLHIQKVLWHNKQIGKTIVCRCAILSFISRQTTKMRHCTVF